MGSQAPFPTSNKAFCLLCTHSKNSYWRYVLRYVLFTQETFLPVRADTGKRGRLTDRGVSGQNTPLRAFICSLAKRLITNPRLKILVINIHFFFLQLGPLAFCSVNARQACVRVRALYSAPGGIATWQVAGRSILPYFLCTAYYYSKVSYHIYPSGGEGGKYRSRGIKLKRM